MIIIRLVTTDLNKKTADTIIIFEAQLLHCQTEKSCKGQSKLRKDVVGSELKELEIPEIQTYNPSKSSLEFKNILKVDICFIFVLKLSSLLNVFTVVNV